ncbi:hypothetical protein CCOS865_02264 [Pseudomonas reidholzensis]|uniref:Uncharacterized protein n=1 Tax=Pseudomonas reidholzensis TaxID=1785162 RepID=A0A383RUE0_9PSED|nr:hypothetical protein [Pseudomonas reidholzensis]SYX89998.1 hypothetical protein CCOS865_02264 [Pseudomonas reidholzensis]
MKRIERDFITLFNCLWYQDFPVIEGAYSNTSNWTIHIGHMVKQCAKLLGARAVFENARTDAVLKFPDGKVLSNVEWEWIEAHKDNVGEIQKLLNTHANAAFSTFISYSAEKNLQATLNKASELWASASKPLIFFVVTFTMDSGNRWFQELQTYVFEGGTHRLYRSQPALPWEHAASEYLECEDGQ